MDAGQDRTPKKERRNKPWRKAFLKTLAATGNVLRACKICKHTRSAVYQERETNAEFAKRWANALEDAGDLLEGEANRRAYEGVARKKFTGKGEPVIDPETGRQYVEQEYSDALLIFLLKGVKPDKFRERISAEHSGPKGKAIEVAIADNGPTTNDRRIAEALSLLDAVRSRAVLEADAPAIDTLHQPPTLSETKPLPGDGLP